MRVKSIILLENNKAVLSQLKDELEKHDEYRLVYAGEDGEEGIRQILREKPDLVITGMFLQGSSSRLSGDYTHIYRNGYGALGAVVEFSF